MDPGEDCDDVQDGWSFTACTGGKAKASYECFFCLVLSGCPYGHVVHNHTSETAHNILTDNCSDEDGDDWLVPKGSNGTDAEVIIDMGCMKKVKGLHMKNIKKEQGGTKNFTIFVSKDMEGPWEAVLTTDFPEQESFGCALMQNFDLGYA